MSELTIQIEKTEEFSRFLMLNGFEVEDLDNSVYQITREDELPVYVKVDETSLYFEVDLGEFSEIKSETLLYKLLDLNTEILPVSVGINSANPDAPHLVLVESRERSNLNDHEILSVFDALELATEKVETVLAEVINA